MNKKNRDLFTLAALLQSCDSLNKEIGGNQETFPWGEALDAFACLSTESREDIQRYMHNADEASGFHFEYAILLQAQKIAEGMQASHSKPDSLKNTHLSSIFSNVSLGKAEQTVRYYMPSWLKPDGCTVPVEKPKISQETCRLQQKELLDVVLSNLTQMNATSIAQLLRSLDALLFHALWALPDTGVNHSSSAYEQARVCSSVISALYDYHEQRQDQTQESVNNTDVEKFVLVSGDLSGIQKYLLELHGAKGKGAAKTLRARSFWITMLTEAVISFVQEQASLSPLSTLVSAGGRFHILAPNTEKTLGALEQAVSIIEQWLFHYSNGTLCYHIVYDTFLAFSDFSPNPLAVKLQQANESLQQAKKRKWCKQLQDDTSWKSCIEDFAEDYHNWNSNTCSLTGLPGTLTEEEDGCYLEETRKLLRVGQILPAATSMSIGIGVPNPDLIFFGGKIGIRIHQNDELPKECLDGDFVNIAINRYMPGMGCKYVANYVPRHPDGTIKTFEEIADEHEGASYLGLLKADVDNLGLLSSLGLKGKTLPQITGFSRMLDFFFSARLPALMESGDLKHKNMYTVFAGGDDLFLIGDWENATVFASIIEHELNKHCAENPDITISAGIALQKSNWPIKNGMEEAERVLDRAKDSGKNRIHLLGYDIPWDQMPVLREFADFLNRQIRDDSSHISIGFVRRLLKYHDMYLQFLAGDISSGIWKSRFRYDIRRNLDKNERGRARSPDDSNICEDARRMLELAGGDGTDKTSPSSVLLRNLRVPITWALYRERRLKHYEQ